MGWRFGKQLAEAVPLAVRYCEDAAEGDNEVQEYCLQALESFVLRAPHDAKTHLEPILATALRRLSFDPNYADAMDEDGDEEEEDEEDDECVASS